MNVGSTRGGVADLPLADALLRGTAPDGGLFVPARLPRGEVRAPRDPSLGESAVAVLSPYRRYDADTILVAAGAWSGLLDEIPIAPVKGEVIALQPPQGAALPGPVVWGEGVYCVPRHGRLLIGATA